MNLRKQDLIWQAGPPPPPRESIAPRSTPPALHSCPAPAHRQKHPRTEQTNQPTEVSPAIHPNRKSQVRGPKRRRGGSGTLAQGLSPPTPPRDPFCRGAPFAQDLGVKGVKASRGQRQPWEGLHQTEDTCWGARVAQPVKHLTSAQVMVSQLMGLSPASGSVLTGGSLEPASDSVSPSLSAPPLLMLCLSLSKITMKKERKKERGHV